MPKSCNCKVFISFNVATLNLPILCIKDSFVGPNSKTSDILREIASAVFNVKYNPDCNICLVAVFEFAAASFCKPTKAFLSGVEPSLASFKPVTSLIICK